MTHPAITLLLILSLSGTAIAQETRLLWRRDWEQLKTPNGWKQYYSKLASEVTITQAGKGRVPSQLNFHERSRQDYFDPRPSDRPTHGSIFLWTHDQLPRAIGGVSSTRADAEQRNVSLSLHSLSDAPTLEAKRNDKLIWNPAGAGIEWIKLPATKPTRKPIVPSSYMRSVLRNLEFVGNSPNSNPSSINLQIQPIYRYSNKQVVAGAVYLAFSGWDPELAILIEKRKPGTKTGWHMAFARLSDSSTRVLQDGKEIWSCDALPPETTDANASYISQTIEKRDHKMRLR